MNKLKDFAYSLANFSGGIVSYAVGSFYMFFYVDQLGLSASYYALAMLFYGIWNAINDPLAGYFSDRTKSRWGRRKPYIMFGAIPLAISFMLVFMPPQFALDNQTTLFLYFLFAMCLYDTFFTIVMLNWSAALPEMYNDEKNRSRVGGISQILGVIGAVGATLLVQPIVNAFGYATMSIIFAIVSAITMLISVYGVREKKENMEEEPLGLIESFKQTFSSKAFIICVTSVLLLETGKILITSSMPFYTGYVLGNDLGVTIIMGAMFISSMIFTPLIVKLAGKIGPKKTYQLSIALYCLGTLGFFVAPNILVVAIISLFLGFAVSGSMIMPNVLYGQIIDEDQIRTGKRREGTYYGINALIMRISIVIQGFVSAFILDSTGYIANATSQTSEALLGFRFLMGLAPCVCFILAFITIKFYPFFGEKLRELREKSAKLNDIH